MAIDNRRKVLLLQVIIAFVLIAGTSILVLSIIKFPHAVSSYFTLKPTECGKYINTLALIGNFIGGICGTLFSLVSIVLLYLTLSTQIKQDKKEHFIQTYYEMLHIHNSNISHMFIERNVDASKIEGKRVFSELLKQYQRVHKKVCEYTSGILSQIVEWDSSQVPNLDEKEILYELQRNLQQNENGECETIMKKLLALYELRRKLHQNENGECETIMKKFPALYELRKKLRYGTSKNLSKYQKKSEELAKSVLTVVIKDKSEEQREAYIDTLYRLIDVQKKQLDQVLEKFFLNDHKRRQQFEMKLSYGYFFFGSENYYLNTKNTVYPYIIKKIETDVRKKFNSGFTKSIPHNVLLGHYYRHMYQMIKLLRETDCLDEDERYVFAKQLRAQLNDDEQLLLYYNAMSDIGHGWVKPENGGDTDNGWLKSDKGETDIRSTKNMCPLARFRMIKNILIPLNEDGMVNHEAFCGIPPFERFCDEGKLFKKKYDLKFFENYEFEN